MSEAQAIAGLPAFDEFPAADAAQWLAAVERSLKGAPLESLRSRSLDGLRIEPLYPPYAGAAAPALRARPGSWRISQRMDHPDPAAAQALALADLAGGADGLTIVFEGSPGAHGFGLRAMAVADLAAALDGVELDLIGVRLDPPGDGLQQARLLAEFLGQRSYPPSALDVDFGCDPASVAADELARLAAQLRDLGHTGRLFMADGRRLHAAGASEAQELAGALGSAVAALRLLTQRGIAVDEARKNIAFLLAADQDQFLTIAKFRAMRRLWARIEAACEIAPQPIRLHAETAWRMMSRRDPHGNVLRVGMAVFAAAVGGADCVTALPFSQALGLPDSDARRLARNSQLILLEEAHLAKVSDPAAGSGGLEALTEALCEKAWAIFQAMAGGRGDFAREIAATAQARRRALAQGEAAMVGVTAFTLAQEPEIAVLAPLPANDPAHSGRQAAFFEEGGDGPA